MKSRKKNRVKFWVVMAVILTVLTGTVVGGYFAIDKILVPNYFGKYGINNLKELVDLVQTIYVIPNEEEFIINPYSKADTDSITKTLANAGFPTLASGEIDFETIGTTEYVRKPKEGFDKTHILISDTQVCALLNQVLSSGILVSNFPDLMYFDTLKMEVKQIVIKPKYTTNPDTQTIEISPTTADIYTTIKVTTASVRSQIAKNLDLPAFLIDWLIPDVLYITAYYTISENADGEKIYTNAQIGINSKTAKQSEVLLSLLLSFIYPETADINGEYLAKELGNLAVEGLNVIGEYEFVQINNKPTYGVSLMLKPIPEEPQEPPQNA